MGCFAEAEDAGERICSNYSGDAHFGEDDADTCAAAEMDTNDEHQQWNSSPGSAVSTETRSSTENPAGITSEAVEARRNTNEDFWTEQDLRQTETYATNWWVAGPQGSWMQEMPWNARNLKQMQWRAPPGTFEGATRLETSPKEPQDSQASFGAQEAGAKRSWYAASEAWKEGSKPYNPMLLG